MWGYRQDGVIVATNPNDMSGNTGWEEVPDGTVPVQQEEEPQELTPTLEHRVEVVEDAVVDITSIVMGVEE